MNKRIIPLLIVLICSLYCLSLVSAQNNTTDNLTSENIEELSNYILPIHITGNGIEFSDGFTGFCIDSSKSSITADDKFTCEKTKNSDVENNIKLAIIEAYKVGKENNLGDIVSQVISGNKEYDVVQAALNSSETVDDTAVVNIDNTTEATFTFELLKPTDDGKSDCLAYKVSLKTIENKDVLGASNDSDSANQTNNSEDGQTNDLNNQTNASAGENSTDGETIINETNKTIINKTNTVIINENNTTTINQKNIKTINNTNETQKNATAQNSLMKATGNPIFLLAIVIVIVAVVYVVMRRKN